MDSRRLHLIIGGILLIVVQVACSLSPASTPVAITSSPTALAENTAVPTKSKPTLASAAPTAATLSASGSGGCANAYYPVPSGASWSYASTGSGIGDYTYTQTITAVSAKGFTASDQFSTGVNATIKWSCQNGNLAVLDAGAGSFSMTTSKVKMTTTSVTADGYNIPATFVTGKTWSEKITVDGTVQASATQTVTSQIAVQFSCTAAGADTITVPAGKFDTVKATCTKKEVVSATEQGTAVPLSTNQQSITYWYAKGVGFVQSVATGGADNETVVLTQYKLK
jgi:hypothetical protein